MQLSQFLRQHAQRIYLDFAAATPVREKVLRAMEPYFIEHFGNPSAIHEEGQRARRAVDDARACIAETLHIRESGVFFTSSGTESNNLALYGFVEKAIEGGRTFRDIEIISTRIEHPSILRVLEDLASKGMDVRYATLGEDGRIDTKSFESLLSEKTLLVTFAYANSEIGVVQDVKRLTRTVRLHNDAHGTSIKIHLDASQAPLWLPCQLDMLGVDLMTLDAGKCYGPKGIGMLAMRHGVAVRGVLLGGEQEMGLRAGTENVPLIVGCAEALVMAQKEFETRSGRMTLLRDMMVEKLLDVIPGAVLNGSHEHRIANNVNISIPGIDSEFAVVTLDVKGIAASTKSACSGAGGLSAGNAQARDGSHVILEITGDAARATSTIRFTLGEDTTSAELLHTIEVLKIHVAETRAFIEKTKQ